jgi:hypothetical protein
MYKNYSQHIDKYFFLTNLMLFGQKNYKFDK